MKETKLLLLSIFAGLFCSAQPISDKLLINLKQWRDNNPQEKVYLQTDRDRYLAGESIWFKGWCTLNNRATYLSRILYVDLIDAAGNVVVKKMYRSDSLSSFNGVIDLDQKLKSGNYSINAYSLWMLNFPEFVFRRNIYVYSADYKNGPRKIQQKFLLNFFPEGGDLIEGVNCRVAFKATNNAGFPETVKGGIYTSAGEKVTDFESVHDGLGSFSFEPSANTKYVAKAVFRNGQTMDVQLPAIKKEGISLQIQNTPSRLFVVINRAELNKEKYNHLFVIAQMNGMPLFQTDFNVDEGRSATAISKKTLPPGIIQITIFDTTGNPLAERLAFIENYNIVQPSVAVLNLNTKKRGSNTLNFSLDSAINPNLSVLVTDSEAGGNHNDNLVSSLLLTSDLKGYVHNPGYYFKDKTPTTLNEIDLLMMTHGWRRFNWEQIKSNEQTVLKYPIETRLNIRGKVTKSSRTGAVNQGSVTVMLKAEDSTSILSNAYLTDKGEFIVDSLNFKEKAKIFYEGTNSKKENLIVDVNIYPSYIDSLKYSAYKPLVNLDTMAVGEVKSGLFSHLSSGLAKLDTSGPGFLQSVTVTTKKISRVDSLQREYVSPLYTESDQTLEVPENRSFVNIWQFLNQNVSGFNVDPFAPGGVTGARFKRFEGLSLSDEDDSDRLIKFFLNEIEVGPTVIGDINPSDVALVKVYKGTLGFAFGADAGAILIYTKKGKNSGSSVFDKSFSNYTKLGYSSPREFFSPNYTKNPELNSQDIDNRLTLYWNPTPKPSKDGKYKIEFHNSDKATGFKLIIQGIDKNGQMIYKEQILQ